MGKTLLGDIGGTNIRLRLVQDDTLRFTLPFAMKSTRLFTSNIQQQSENLGSTCDPVVDVLLPALKEFIGGETITSVCLSVCGPVVDGSAICLALSMGAGWLFTERIIASGLGLHFGNVKLVNDFVAIGAALPHIPQSRMHCLVSGVGKAKPFGKGNLLCMGVGTGLGVVQSVYNSVDNNYFVNPSEAGMASFCPKTKDQWTLLEWCRENVTDGDKHVTVETLVSGSGISSIYKFYHEKYECEYRSSIGDELDTEILLNPLSGNIIAANATSSLLCKKTMDTFLTLLGEEAGDNAMRFRPEGGLVLAGGFTDKILPLLQNGVVIAAFLRKGRATPCCQDIPLYASDANGDDLTTLGLFEYLHSNKVLNQISNCIPQVFDSYVSMSQAAAQIILSTVRIKPDAVLCLATGATPSGTYEILCQEMDLNPNLFQFVRIVKLDEWLGLPSCHPATCEYYLQQHFLSKIGMIGTHADGSRYLAFQSDASSPEAECQRVSNQLREWGGIDVCTLGIGVNGHIGMNEPMDTSEYYDLSNPFECRISELTPSTQQHAMLVSQHVCCQQGYTLGLGAIAAAKEIILMANGSSKTEAIRNAVAMPLTRGHPANTLLRLHQGNRLHLFCDMEAAGGSLFF